jgi:hypothetical protein
MDFRDQGAPFRLDRVVSVKTDLFRRKKYR